MLETTGHLPETKVTIIGEGKWGKKVRDVLSGVNLEAKSISAREFLLNPHQSKSFEPDVIFWICTRPDLQLVILEILIQLHAEKVILEKPCFTSVEEYRSLEVILNDSKLTKLFISEPWRHSALWKDAKSLILGLVSECERINIQVSRKSNELRDFASPVQDWIPHDFSLMYDLALDLGNSKLYISEKFFVENNLIQGSAFISENLEIDYSIGYSPKERIAKWQVNNGTQVLTIDFTEMKILDQEHLESSIMSHYIGDNPLINQYVWVSRQSHDPHLVDKLEIQKRVLLSV